MQFSGINLSVSACFPYDSAWTLLLGPHNVFQSGSVLYYAHRRHLFSLSLVVPAWLEAAIWPFSSVYFFF